VAAAVEEVLEVALAPEEASAAQHAREAVVDAARVEVRRGGAGEARDDVPVRKKES
jgi:hypothetical protein